jgi:hypothetical protein
MENIYTFDEKEKRKVDEARQLLFARLQAIATINGLNGNLDLNPDGSGFILKEPPKEK